MRITLRQSQSGIALIIVMIVIVVMGVFAFQFAYSMKIETKLARNASFEPDLEWMARSAVERAKWMLSHESTGPGGQADALIMRTFGGPGRTNDFISMEPLKDVPIDKGFCDVATIDLDRKININMADKILLQEALTYIGIEDGVLISTIIDSIVDWRDRDTSAGISGAESSDYMSTPNPGYPPYKAKDGPIDDMSEMLMIKGVTPGIYWGSKAGAYSTLLKRRSGFEEPVYTMGLVDIFTALSSGRININTVDERVLQALPGIDAIIAGEILRPRRGLDGQDGTQDDVPVANVNALAGLFGGAGGQGGQQNQMAQQFLQYLTTRSLMFEVTVDARIGNIRKRYVALLRRNGPKDIQTLSMYSR
jgi:general secretion pathway protein K